MAKPVTFSRDAFVTGMPSQASRMQNLFKQHEILTEWHKTVVCRLSKVHFLNADKEFAVKERGFAEKSSVYDAGLPGIFRPGGERKFVMPNLSSASSKSCSGLRLWTSFLWFLPQWSIQ